MGRTRFSSSCLTSSAASIHLMVISRSRKIHQLSERLSVIDGVTNSPRSLIVL
jgi:hypothetical protein